MFKQAPPKPRIDYVNNRGRIHVSFSRPILVPTFERFPEFNSEVFLNKTCSNGGTCDSTRLLQTEKESDEALQIVNYGKVMRDNKLEPIVDI